MKLSIIPVFAFFAFSSGVAQVPKTISECTVVYDLSVDDPKADAELVKTMKGTTRTLYIKGTHSRSDLNSPAYTQTTLTNTKSDTVVILRELGNVKYMTYLGEAKRAEQNKKFEAIVFSETGESKTILGYDCKKVTVKLKDGSVYQVYYAPSIIPSNNLFEYQFKDLQGFVLEYETESENGKVRIKYLASKISLSPIPIAKFDLPKSGYRIL